MYKAKKILINEHTGEILEEIPGVFIPQAQAKIYQRYQKIKEEFREQGEFVWLLYKKAEELSLDIAPANLTRLIYLSTFMNYNNRLVSDSKNNLGIDEPLDKKWLVEIMGLPKNTFYRFYNEVIANEILIERPDGYYLNEEFFKKGVLNKNNINGKMRMYRYSIRNLYLKASLKDHKMLGYGFMILPYVNIEYNILCWNPEEKDIDKIQLLDISKMLEIFGYDSHNWNRFKKQLMSVMVGKYHFIHIVDDEKLFVSPNVYYAGTNRKRVIALGGFDNMDRKNKN